jgi:hypothetical protein
VLGQQAKLGNGREGEDDLAPVGCFERRLGLEPARVHRLDPVGLRRRVGGGEGEVEASVEAGRDHLGGDPAGEKDELLLDRQLDPGLLGELAHSAGPAARFALPVGRVDRAAGEDPDVRHEAGLGAALQHQHLERALGVLATAAQEDDRGRWPRLRRRPEIRHLCRSELALLSEPPLLRHRRSLPLR